MADLVVEALLRAATFPGLERAVQIFAQRLRRCVWSLPEGFFRLFLE